MDNAFIDIDEHVHGCIDQYISDTCASCGQKTATISVSFDRRADGESWIDWLNQSSNWYYIDRCLLSNDTASLILAVCEDCVQRRRWMHYMCRPEGAYTALVAGVDFERREDM